MGFPGGLVKTVGKPIVDSFSKFFFLHSATSIENMFKELQISRTFQLFFERCRNKRADIQQPRNPQK